MKTDALTDLVRDIKYAVQGAQAATPSIIVTKAQLELKTVFAGGVGAEGKLGPVELSGHYTDNEVQRLALTLVPSPADIELMATRSDQLMNAIIAISEAANFAASAQPRFSLSEATVEINFGVDKNGKAHVFVGGEVATSKTHTLILTLMTKP